MQFTQIQERAVAVGRYIVENNTTVRVAAKKFGISKSTVHKDVTCKLKTIDPKLCREVKAVLAKNKMERHIRGGLATKHKYEQLNKLKTKNKK